MRIAIQQPEHLPWLGFFNKMISVDEFIYLDSVQFKKRYFENRNKIRIAKDKGWNWITVPVLTKGLYNQKISDVEIDYTGAWENKYLKKIWHSYRRSDFFDEIFQKIEHIVNKRVKRLLQLNIELIDLVRNYLGITTPVMFASDICEGKGSELILKLCVRRNASTYLSGPDGRNYLDLDAFSRRNIEVRYHDYNHVVYGQLHEPFISHMSIIDLLFNYGKNSIEMIKKTNQASIYA